MSHSNSLQGVSITPRFIFGVDGSIKNSLYEIGEKKLIYVAGSNVIIYNMNELDKGTQFFVPGEEGNEGINHISLSQNKELMAIC
jgi:hypothetical protein